MKISIENKANFNDEQLKNIYKTMWIIRLFEEKVDFFFAQGKIHGTTHLAVGQEATAAGSGAVLDRSDWITATHRGHGQTIGKGTDVKAMMAELFGRSTGTNKGKGGSMHIAELETGNLGANGIVGGGYPIATGAALTSHMKKDGKVTVCYAGDGSTNQGSFHEAVNMASIWKLPIIYFIENNKYGMSGNIHEMTNIQDLSERSKSYGIPGIKIDGNDIIEVINTTFDAVERARNGEGPTLIEAITYRWKGHSKSDARKYRTRDEENYWKENMDPIENTRLKFIEAGVFLEDEANKIKQEAEKIIEEAVEFAEASPFPSLNELMTDVYAE